ncbi:MAG: ABC transporter ATP-binding protein [Chloroflexi bacterium]|nr:ABC transporter ATP-binding protein [Chloroflexota bacterium]
MSSYAVRTRDLQRSFGSLRAVNGITFEVERGTVFGFLGPNGSGKTTTIRILLGLLDPSGGQAEVLGYDTRTQAAEIRQRSGALLEHTGLYERLSAYDNLEFYGRVWHIPAGERRARIREVLTRLALWERREEIVAGWSRGMKQKLAVARALLHRPQIVFLDEPSAGLDPLATAGLQDDLAEMARQEGVTVFLTTHNLAEAEKLCQRVAVIRQGRLLAVDSPDGLRIGQGGARMTVLGHGLTPPVLEQLRLRPEVAGAHLENGHLVIDLRGTVDTAPLVQWLVMQGVQIEEVRKGKASLEEVFLTLMEEGHVH